MATETLATPSSSPRPPDAWIESHRRLLARRNYLLPQPPTPISISRVNQFDAARLDVEMSAMLKEQLVKVFSMMKPGFLFQYEPELDAFLEFKEGGQRNWMQVLANSGIASVLAIVLLILNGGQDICLNSKESKLVTALIGGIIGHYACCNGDTWSSELGMLSNAQPRLITTFKTVRKGTNGAVTLDGFLAAAAAGFVIGISYLFIGLLTVECDIDVARRQLLVVPIATAAGLLGSLIDSLLGATLQFSGYCAVRKKVVGRRGQTVTKISGMSVLNNNGVNALSILLTALLTCMIHIMHVHLLGG